MGGALPEAVTGDDRWAVHLGSGAYRRRGRERGRHRRGITRASPTVTSRSGRWMLRAAGGEPANDDDPGTPPDGMPWGVGGESRITIADAGILQSFPPGYPWRGGRNSQYRQVGNAFPPLAAASVLAAATGFPAPRPAGLRCSPGTTEPATAQVGTGSG